ncbi:MAG TPA: prephenate dehydratase [Dehalococcoidia bacterium]|nr:prephenate dehydratase [Dehalococcoidia bacterium]
MTKRLAYFGPPGTNTEDAAISYADRVGGSFDLMPLTTITSVANAVMSGEADQGVVPIENSLEGAINETLDLLIHSSQPLFIHDEQIIPIDHLLLALPGTRREDIAVIKSIPVAIAQCRGFIDREFPDAEVEGALSTAAAVEAVMTRQGAAAIASARAADLYGAEVIASGIQDRTPNFTRFVIVASEDHAPTGDDRTSVAFTFANEDRPGQLMAALQDFASRSINLSKIESRPSKEKLGTYIFLVDVQGHRKDAGLGEALSSIEKNCSIFRVLGSYPRYRLLE